MKKGLIVLGLGIAGVATAYVLSGGNPTAEAPSVATVGKAAPTFALPDTAGKNHTLEAYKGKWVVLEWTNHDCPIVVRHYNSGNMQATQKWATEKGVVWLQVVSSAPGEQGHISTDQAKEIMKSRKDVSTQMLFDPSGKVGKLYDAKTTPHMYIINPEGQLVYNGGIDNNSNGRATEVTNYVKQGLEEGLAGKPISVPTSRPYGCNVKYAR